MPLISLALLLLPEVFGRSGVIGIKKHSSAWPLTFRPPGYTFADNIKSRGLRLMAADAAAIDALAEFSISFLFRVLRDYRRCRERLAKNISLQHALRKS